MFFQLRIPAGRREAVHQPPALNRAGSDNGPSLVGCAMASALTQTCRFFAALFAVCVCAGSLVSSSPTVTVTVSQWTTTTTISPKMTYGICASLISASEPCPVITKQTKTSTKADKKKKKKKEETTTPPLVPVYVAFDDELHEYLLEYFEPSAVVK